MSCITLKQVAELTGKSEATVSLVLNSKQFHRVSPKTRREIEAVAERLGYTPNLQAQALVRGKTRSIAITAVGMTPFYNEYIRRLTHLFEKQNYNVFAFETMLNPEREKQVVNWVSQGLFDGCICLEYNYSNRSFYDTLVKNGMPHVFRGWNALEFYPEHMIRVDYRSAISELFAHLETQGYRRLSVIIDGSSYFVEEDSFSVRKSLYYELIHNRQLTIDPEAWITVPIDVENHLHYSYEKTREMLARCPDVDVLIVQSAADIPAVYKAAAETGRRIGADLAVATFDRIPMLDYMAPPVTYIHEPCEAIADLVAAEMLAQLGVTEMNFSSRKVEAVLSVNDSTLKMM